MRKRRQKTQSFVSSYRCPCCCAAGRGENQQLTQTEERTGKDGLSFIIPGHTADGQTRTAIRVRHSYRTISLADGPNRRIIDSSGWDQDGNHKTEPGCFSPPGREFTALDIGLPWTALVRRW